MLTVLDLAREDTHLHKESARSWCGPCPNPNCSKRRDGFVVKWDNEYERWSFSCRGCWDCQEILSDQEAKSIGKPGRAGEMRGFGDAINYLRHYRNMRYPQARDFLGEQNQEPTKQRQTRYNPISKREPYDHTSLRWQNDIHKAVAAYQASLWAPSGAAALEYIRKRGINDEIIRSARLGYTEKDDIPRLVIPAYQEWPKHIKSPSDAQPWYTAIYRRDLRPDIPKDKRWRDALGSTKNELYLADCLKYKRPTVMVEAAIDALSIVQECGNMVNVVATGSVTGVKDNINALAQLARMPMVLLAFDADSEGDECAAWWKKRLKNAHRLRPILHDVNDMLVDNWDIRAWVGMAIAEINREKEPVIPERCADCGTHIEQEDRLFFYIPLPNDPDQAECYCSLCRDEAGQLLPPPAPLAAGSREQFMSAVKQIADSFPGGCEIHIDPPDYTLADRVKELQQAEQQEANKKQSFWERIEEQNASFDPKKRVKWQNYGYKKDNQGKWFYPRKDKKHEEKAVEGEA